MCSLASRLFQNTTILERAEAARQVGDRDDADAGAPRTEAGAFMGLIALDKHLDGDASGVMGSLGGSLHGQHSSRQRQTGPICPLDSGAGAEHLTRQTDARPTRQGHEQRGRQHRRAGVRIPPAVRLEPQGLTRPRTHDPRHLREQRHLPHRDGSASTCARDQARVAWATSTT